MYGAVFHIDNDLYHSSTMLITIQQPPYNSTLNCQITHRLERVGTMLPQAVKHKEVSAMQTALYTEAEWSVSTYCTIARWVSAE